MALFFVSNVHPHLPLCQFNNSPLEKMDAWEVGGSAGILFEVVKDGDAEVPLGVVRMVGFRNPNCLQIP